ncbi:TlpA family protein disulfide reductase [Paenibacillus puerhi]|uniref:TlpA family protein disulfide reductase n=1 Tax=Paenibacillus puerhi TaxID=2692622 RepID=UPI001359D4DA|nr:TlpA disulfide reductase family protein [Paenibacillus puerhi]
MKNKNAWFAAAALALVLTGIWQMVRADRMVETATASARPVIGKELPVPVEALKGLDGKEYRVGGERDKPMLLNFWASWCGPCHEEAPALKQVYERYGSQFDLYAVNVTKEDRLKEVKSFVDRYKLEFPVLLDTTGKAAEDFRILFVPTSFLIDKQGRLVETIHVLSPEALEQKIKKLIASEPAV